MRMIVLVLAVVLAGCAYNGQNFDTNTLIDRTETKYFDPVQQPDGVWVSFIKSHRIDTLDDKVKGKNKSTAPPFNSKNNAEAQLRMTEGATDQGDPTWTVDMGQVGEIEGGDVTPIIGDAIDAGVAIGTGGLSEIVPD